jgi:hypothetical protein
MSTIPPDALKTIQEIQNLTQLLKTELDRIQNLAESFDNIEQKFTDFQGQAVQEFEGFTSGLQNEFNEKVDDLKGQIQTAINEALKIK